MMLGLAVCACKLCETLSLYGFLPKLETNLRFHFRTMKALTMLTASVTFQAATLTRCAVGNENDGRSAATNDNTKFRQALTAIFAAVTALDSCLSHVEISCCALNGIDLSANANNTKQVAETAQRS